MIYFYMKINVLHVWILLEETDGTTESRNSLSKDINYVQWKDFNYLMHTISNENSGSNSLASYSNVKKVLHKRIY